MAVQSYSENESEIRKKKTEYKNMGNSMLVGRTSLTIIIFLNSIVFYNYLSLQYQMLSVSPIVIYFQIEFSSLYLTNCFHDYKPQVNSKLVNEGHLRILKS